MPNNSQLTLFSSESTIRYVKDIFNVLALPEGALYQFRYENKYVSDDVLPIFANDESVSGLRALVCFRSVSDCSEDECFFLPIRWVRIENVKKVANFYIVTFKALSYPEFSDSFDDSCREFSTINMAAKEFFKETTMNNKCAVKKGVPSIVAAYNEANDDNKNWLKIVKAFSLIPNYENCHFLKFSGIFMGNETPCPVEKSKYILVEGEYVFIQVDYYRKNYSLVTNGKLNIVTDSSSINVATGIGTELESRYDSVKLGFQAKKVMANSISEINVFTSSESNNIPTKVVFSVKIVKNKVTKFIKSLITACGAFFVGLPGLLDTSVSINLQIGISIVGVLMLGINTYIEGRD